MIQLLVVSHGKLCEGLLDAYRMLAGDCLQIHAVSLTETGIDDFRTRLHASYEEVASQGSVLVLADLMGGTPYNESYALLLEHPDNLRLVAGANLPMLLSCGLELADEQTTLESLYQLALESGPFGVSGAEPPSQDPSDGNSEEDLF